MGGAVNKAIYLPSEMAKETEGIARAKGTTFGAVIREALYASHTVQLKRELKTIQGCWSRKAKETVMLTETDFEQMLFRK